MTATKRELLLAIIDHPGTDPGSSRETHEWADELVTEGWIEEAMGGFVPTAKALDEHPHFASQPDIADPTAPAFGAPDSEFVQQAAPKVTDNVRDRVAMLFVCLLGSDLTLGAAYKGVALAPQLEVHETAVETELCRQLADRLLQGIDARSFPHPDGDTTVLGPEIFASSDGSVISWRGENYHRERAEGDRAA